MQILDVLNHAQGGAALSNVATAFGVNPDKAAPAIQTMLEALSERIERNTISRGGLADFVELLNHDVTGRAIDDGEGLAGPETAAIGNHVLNVLIGDKDSSRAIAKRAAKDSGLDEQVLKKMLPTVASMLIGGLQKQTAGTFAERLRGVPGLNISAGGSPLQLPGDDVDVQDDRGGAGQWNDLPKQAGGGNSGQWNNLPKPSGGGGGMGGSLGGGGPLPIPGDDIPGLDRPGRFPGLPDVVRRGGTQVPGPNGGSLEEIIRSILGSLLGFQGGGGMFSNIIKFFLARWFLGFIKRMFSRVALGR